MQALPERIGRYRVLSRLGAGGMGEVFLAHDDQLDRQVDVQLRDAPPRIDGTFGRSRG